MKPRPHLVTSEVSRNLPILIVDKTGFVGSALAEKLKDQFLVVLVTARENIFDDKILHVAYKRKIPVIPDNSYSHIFVFYNDEEEILEMLPTFVKKANDTKGKILFLTTLLHSKQDLFKRLSHHLYREVTVVLYGEVFDNNLNAGNMVNLFIHQARVGGRIEIPNEGLGKLYPVYIEDVLIVIIASAFSHDIKGGRLAAFPKYPFTEITVARIFQKLNPDLLVDFNKRRIRNFNYFIPEGFEHAFSNYRLEQGLKKINLSSSGYVNLNVKRAVKTLPRAKRNLRMLYAAIVALFLLPIILVAITSAIGFSMIGLSAKQAEKGSFKSASQSAAWAGSTIAIARGISDSYLPADILFKRAKEDLVHNYSITHQVAEMENSLFSSLSKISDIYMGISQDPSVDFRRSTLSIKNTLLKLEEMRAQKQLPDAAEKKLSQASYLLTLLENTTDSLPQILGFKDKKKYLLLFQNNMELRPGGGFIGSYGVLSLDKGRSEKLEVHDVYDADGRLKTHIEPPYGLRRYGGVSHLFLRDTNFDIDFTTDAAAATDIFKRETGESVDGVVGIDTNFIKNLLAATGPVTVDGYKEKVTESNFYLLTQKHAEDNFFPGSTQKKDFLRALLTSILNRINSPEGISYFKLAKALEKSIKEKHVLVAFHDPNIQEVFTANKLSGNLWDKREKSDNSILDTFGVVDANIGANKSNYYLNRSITQSVTVTDTGSIDEIAEVNYENTSKKGSVFGGDYKNYIRFVLPDGATLKSVSIDGVETPTVPAITESSIVSGKNFTPPKELEIETTQVDGKQSIGFFMIVPQSARKKVTISYAISQGVNTALPEYKYNLRIFKQPGTDQDPYTLFIYYPSKFSPLNLSRNLVDVGGKLTYETNLSTDKDISIRFTQR